ncbi:MAG TPA: hypothetical protein VMF29_06920 [Candidatus Edwardsbacteria bacterium]|nr:hypothetical protein [Candidatus Edwardsbacteria bacterium]
MTRIMLLTLLAAASLAAQVKPMPGSQPQDQPAMKAYPQFWRDGKYCRQDDIDLAKIGQGTVRAKVDGKWQTFTLRQLPDKFLDWNFRERLRTIETLKKGGMPNFAGPHSGMVASHGFRRDDGQFTINNAVKGMGFLPTKEHLAGLLAELEASKDSSEEYKFGWLTKLYTERKDWLDPTKQVSLELYATPEFATHTFLNQMTDPGVSIVFLDMMSFELRAITQLLHPDDPKLTEYDKQVVAYVNGIHDYFHGASPRPSIVAVYHVVEVFDNTPGRGRGKRVVPPLP